MLEQRRVRGKLTETYKILRGFDNVDCSKFFTPAPVRITGGNSLKMCKKNVRLNCRKYFFSRRVIDDWNRLSEDVVNACSVGVF